MEAVMNKVYKSFDQLMEENEEIFEVLKKKGGSGLYRAIWEARDVEIEVLEEGLSNQISEKDNLEKKILQQEKDIASRDKTIDDFKNVIKDQDNLIKETEKIEETTDFVIQGLKQQISSLEDEKKSLLNENAENKNVKIKMGKVCEQFNQMKKALDQSQRGEVDLTKMVRLLKSKKEDLENSLSKVKKREMSLGYELDKYKKNLSQLKSDYKRDKSFFKNEFKKLQEKLKLNFQKLEKSEMMNHKMESELFRLNGDIKSLRPSDMTEILRPKEQSGSESIL